MAFTSTCATTTTLLLTLLALLVASTHAAATDTLLSVFPLSQDLRVGPSMLAILTIGVGLLVCVAGYWLIRGVFFACGFVVGALATASAIEHFFENQSWLELASWVGFVVGGVAFGLAVVSLYSLSVFVAGAAGGVLLAFAIHVSIDDHVGFGDESGPSLLFLVLVIVLGIVGGVLTLLLEKPLLIVTTSFVGAVASAWGVGYFAGGFPTSSQLTRTDSEDDDPDDQTASVPTAWWGYLVGISVLFVVGMVVQFHKTREYHHTHSRPTQFQQRTAFLRPVPPPAYADRGPVVYVYAGHHPPTNDRNGIARV